MPHYPPVVTIPKKKSPNPKVTGTLTYFPATNSGQLQLKALIPLPVACRDGSGPQSLMDYALQARKACNNKQFELQVKIDAEIQHVISNWRFWIEEDVEFGFEIVGQNLNAVTTFTIREMAPRGNKRTPVLDLIRDTSLSFEISYIVSP